MAVPLDDYRPPASVELRITELEANIMPYLGTTCSPTESLFCCGSLVTMKELSTCVAFEMLQVSRNRGQATMGTMVGIRTGHRLVTSSLAYGLLTLQSARTEAPRQDLQVGESGHAVASPVH